MNREERYWRALTARERVDQLQAELLVLAEAAPEGSEEELLEAARAYLFMASETLLSLANMKPNFELTLVRSIDWQRKNRPEAGTSDR